MLETSQSTLLERYQRLVEISRDLASTLDLGTLLNRIVHAAADLCNAQAASILLYDEVKQQLFFESATNLDEPLMRGLIVPVEGSIAGWIVTNRQPVIISDAQTDNRHFQTIQQSTQFTTRSLLGTPMITKDKIVGVLEALNKRSGEFNEEDQNVLIALSAQAAVAIENTRLFQQSDLISEMVHELRTPLSSINTASYLLLRPDISAEQRRRMVEIIQTETSRLTEMTTSFLDLARLESGRTQFHALQFSLPELIQECITLIAGKAGEQGITIDVDLSPSLPGLVADRDKMKQVILNLLTNAIKYNRRAGTIEVKAALQGEKAHLSVRDSGPGIRPEDLKHLFEKFYRVQGAEKVATGTGLGLAICKRIIEAHSGEIEVDSQVGQGTVFNVYLPLRMAD